MKYFENELKLLYNLFEVNRYLSRRFRQRKDRSLWRWWEYLLMDLVCMASPDSLILS